MKNKTLILSLAAAVLFIAAPAFADTAVPTHTCKVPAKNASDAAFTEYYSCMDDHVQAQRKAADNHNKAIDAALEQMREIHTFDRK